METKKGDFVRGENGRVYFITSETGNWEIVSPPKYSDTNDRYVGATDYGTGIDDDVAIIVWNKETQLASFHVMSKTVDRASFEEEVKKVAQYYNAKIVNENEKH